MPFKWNRSFETGIAIVDAQHRQLVKLINDAEPLLTGGEEAASQQLGVLLEDLDRCAATHFACEEGVMRSHGLLPPYIEKQHADHQGFRDQLRELRGQLVAESLADVGPGLLRFLTSWLSFHILDEDQRMARQIRLTSAGESPEGAFAGAAQVVPDDQARAVLVAALTDLYAVLGERNRSLFVSNEKLKQSSRQLELLNQQLEATVAERTVELRQTLTAMARTQGQLLQSEKLAAVGQLAAGVAHEINNPIGFVTSNLGSLKAYVGQLLEVIDAFDALRDVLPATDARRQKLEQACDRGDLDYLRQDIGELIDESSAGLLRVSKIVQGLKDFARVDESDWQMADINAALESTINVARSELKYKATMVRNYGQLPPVRCLAAQLNQVFLNLLINAAQAIEDHGTITLTTGCGQAMVWIEISDTGCGMGEDVQRRIFEPFYTTRPVGKGTGLGLSISWDIVVHKHRGTIGVASEPGRGTRFRIELPVNAAPAEEDRNAHEILLQGAGLPKK